MERRAIAAAARFGLATLLRFARANVLGSTYRLGDWDETFTGAEVVIREAPGGVPELTALEMRAHIRVARGDLVGAKQDAARGVEIGRALGDPQALFPAISTAAYVHAVAGDPEAARPFALEVMERWKRMDNRIPMAAPGETIGVYINLFGREEVANRLAADTFLPTPWLEAARAFAGNDFQKALELYERIESPPDQAAVHLHAAESLAASGQRAEVDAHLQSALAFYRSVDATWYIRQAETLLAASA
jgi:hypothetical protein